MPVPWPGWNTGAWFQEAAKPQTVGSERYWLGSLSVEMRDASGLMYKRNRYYNPQTGQFTQPDPIGLAGGLNIYGLAAGDPVSYSDPYGLAVQCDPQQEARHGRLCPMTVVAGSYTRMEIDETSILIGGASLVEPRLPPVLCSHGWETASGNYWGEALSRIQIGRFSGSSLGREWGVFETEWQISRFPRGLGVRR